MSRPILGVPRIQALGPALRDLRKSQDVGIYDVAEAMSEGVEGPRTHGTQITSWETGRILLGTRKLVQLLDVYDYQIVFMHRDDFIRLLARGGRGD